MHSFLLALQFLTIVPVVPFAAPAEPRPAHFGRAVALFPLAGLLIGVALVAIDAAASLVWPPAVAAALVLAALLLITGALHFDGLLDTFDGAFLWQPERRLEVMRDSRVGGFAVAGGVAVYALKLAAVAALDGAGRTAALLLAPALGRAGMAAAIVFWPYARASGQGSAFKQAAHRRHAAAAAALASLAALAFGWSGAAALVVAVAGTGALAAFLARRLGGLTGDTYGCICEVVETLVLLTLAALPPRLVSWSGMP